MRTSSYAPFYDLFKLIVAIILLAIVLFMLWNVTPPSSPAPPAATWTPPPPSAETAVVSPTPAPPTDTASPTLNSAIVTATATPTPPSAENLTSTPTASPTLPPVTETLPTPIVEIPSEPNACAAVSRSRLQVGMRATILRRLNFRSSPGIMNNWMLTNIPGTQVEVIGGPACTIYKNGGSYLWWQIKLPNGIVGWSAEASAFGAFYFMEPTR